MPARRLVAAIVDLLADRGHGAIRYQCRDCAEVFETPQSNCPDCGGSVNHLPVDPSPLYVGPPG